MESSDQPEGDKICTFPELQCIKPKGIYNIKVYPSFIQLNGKYVNVKIPLTTVLKMFRLPHQDGRQVYFVLSLEPLIKQAQTRYHFLIMLFNLNDELAIELNIMDEVRDKFDGKIQDAVSGITVDVLERVMELLVQRKVTIPTDNFGGRAGAVIGCSYKRNKGYARGYIYPLDRGFIFIHSPPVHIRFEEIQSILFNCNGAGSNKTFDFEVELQYGIRHEFCRIAAEEYKRLKDFLIEFNVIF